MNSASLRRWVVTSVIVSILFAVGGAHAPVQARAGLGPAAEGAAVDLAKQLTSFMVEERFEEVAAHFGPRLEGALSASDLAAVWTSLPLQVGTLKDVGEPWVAATEPQVLVRTPLYFAAATMDLVFGFDSDFLLGTLVLAPHEPRPPAGPDTGATHDVGTSSGAAPPPVPAGDSTPPYADVQRFEEYELTFGVPGFPLGGTLTLPVGDGPFPAVVLVHGSGPHDRDETTGPNKPFRDLAWGLASRGVAVFRYDKRTLVHGAAMAADPVMTADDKVIIDAVEAARMLSARDDIGRVYIVGHSLGGMLAPYMALEAPHVSGLVLMAANARPLGTLILEQVDYLLSGHAVPGTEPMLQAMRADAQRLAAGDFDGVHALLGAPVHYWLDLESRDHVGTAAALPQPMLILHGGRDYQVTTTEFEMWKEALSHKHNVTFRLYPDLNHLFMSGVGPATPVEYGVPGFVAAEVIEDIAAWIHALD